MKAGVWSLPHAARKENQDPQQRDGNQGYTPWLCPGSRLRKYGLHDPRVYAERRVGGLLRFLGHAYNHRHGDHVCNFVKGA